MTTEDEQTMREVAIVQSNATAAKALLEEWRDAEHRVVSLTQQCKELLKAEEGWLDAILDLQNYIDWNERGEMA